MSKKNSHILQIKNFSPNAKSLRFEFDEKFKNPLEGKNERFVWDYWHVPDQYTLCRTPAYHYFSKNIYESFHQELLRYGREVLGCYDITPPWLSYYVDGFSQELHADVPHGPWAFVYSLTNWKSRAFTGGETLILKPETLDYWRSFEGFNGVELGDLSHRVPANFNQLLVFDPRLPHGVREVRGTKDPRESRLVIHGWFKDPEPYVVGGLSRASATKTLNEFLSDHFEGLLSDYADCHGTLSVSLEVLRTGEVRSAKYLTNTLLSLSGEHARVSVLSKKIIKLLLGLKFSKSKTDSKITLPLLFRF